MAITNLFAYRAKDPKQMLANVTEMDDPENDRTICDIARRAAMVVVGWGRHGQHLGRDKHVLSLLRWAPLRCLKRNSDGSPVHPLYQPKGIKPVAWWVPTDSK